MLPLERTNFSRTPETQRLITKKLTLTTDMSPNNHAYETTVRHETDDTLVLD